MNRKQYLQEVIQAYLDAPDTPSKARPRDWAIATTFFQQGVSVATIAHAIRLATLRRHRRDPNLGLLEPIRSLAYFRPLIDHLRQEPHHPGYIKYVQWSYDHTIPGVSAKNAARRQNPAVPDRR